MRPLTWDIGILAVLAILVAYSVFIRKHKSLATLVSVYISYFIATSWGDKIAGFFNGDQVLLSSVWIQANATPFAVQVTLLVIFTFLLSSFIKLGGRRSRYGLVEVGAYSVCTVALGLMFILLIMPEDLRQTVLASASIPPLVYDWREWILVIPVFVMVYFGIYGDDDL